MSHNSDSVQPRFQKGKMDTQAKFSSTPLLIVNSAKFVKQSLNIFENFQVIAGTQT